MKVSCALALLASMLVVPAHALNIYADQVCVENNVAGDINFSVLETITGVTVGSHDNFLTSQTRCSRLSSTPGISLQLKVSAFLGETKTITPEFQFGEGCTINFKCAGMVKSYRCKVENDCTQAPKKVLTGSVSNDCVNPILSDVTYYDVTFEPVGLGASTTACNNTEGNSILSCTAPFSATQTSSETVTASSTDNFKVTGTITFKEPLGVIDATQSVSVTYSGSYTEGRSKTTTRTFSPLSSCATTLPAGSCAILRGTYAIGTIKAKWKGTMTCADGRQVSGYGNLNSENAASEAEITSCQAEGCPAVDTLLQFVESNQRGLRGMEPEVVTDDVTYYDQFCVRNAMANEVHFYVYDSAGTQVASYGNIPVGETKCVWLTAVLQTDHAIHASIATDCWACHDRTTQVPAFSYKPGANKKFIYDYYGTKWSLLEKVFMKISFFYPLFIN